MVGQKSVFVLYFNLNSKLEFLNSLSGRFMNYQIFELSSFFVAHSDEKLEGVGITVPPAPLPHLVVKFVQYQRPIKKLIISCWQFKARDA